MLQNADRRGMLLPLTLLIAGMLLVTGLAVWRVNTTDVQQITVNVRRVQAQYLAKGALQLALLKAKLFPTPLYDAAAYSVGKNPYYVHSKGYAHLGSAYGGLSAIFPGPAFLTGEVEFSGTDLIRKKVKEITDQAQRDDLNTEDGLTAQDFRVDRYLNFFALDLADSSYSSPMMVDPPGGSVAGQTSVLVSSGTNCPIFGKPDPYSGDFRILKISVRGASKQYGVETLEVIAVANVTSKMAGEDKSWSTREETFYKVSRTY